MKQGQIPLIVFLIILLAACSDIAHKSTLEPRFEQSMVLSGDYKINDVIAIEEVGEASLLLSSEAGLLELKTFGAKQVETPLAILWNGDFEGVDARFLNGDSASELLIASIDQKQQRPVLLYQKKIISLEPTAFQVDGLCLYQSPGRDLYLYLIDGYGGGEVRKIYQASKRSFLDLSIKPLNLPAGVGRCRVDDEQKKLFILEEELGLWAYPAEPEAPEERRLLVHSAAQKELKGFAKFGDALFVSDSNKPSILLYQNGQANSPQFEWPLDEGQEPEALAIVGASNLSALYYVDDARSALMQLSFHKKPDAKAHKEFLSAASKNQSSLKVNFYPEIYALNETAAMDRRGDAADDPAIWFNSQNSEDSRVLGTNKKYGLLVFNLRGEQLQALKVGNVNNVDLRQNIVWASNLAMDIAVASNRSDNSLAVFSIDQKGLVSEAGTIATNLDDVYGLCLYQPQQDQLFALVNDKDGRLQQYRLFYRQGKISGELVAQAKLSTQPEGCVADDQQGTLFVGEEDRGVWHFRFNAQGHLLADSGQLIIPVGKALVDDVEGLALFINKDQRLLLVSSQGDNSYALYQAEPPFNYMGSFRVGINTDIKIDGTSETDGLDVSSHNFGQGYEQGLIVIQDGHNYLPVEPQNFKLLPWQQVMELLLKE